jgi:hypothetical protein
MNSLLLSSDGFQVGSFLLPPFQLHAGECVCLHLPEATASTEVEQLIRDLTGKTPLPAVRLFGRVVSAAPLRKCRHGLSGFFRPMRVADWLSRTAGASPAQAQSILQRLHPDERQCRIEQLPGTPKKLLSVETAWLTGAQGIIFTTVGLDPLGREAVYEAVSSHFPQWCAIHLSFPFLQDGQRMRQCFTGTTCLELERSTEASRSITTIPRRR